MSMRRPVAQQGFTLIELMVSLVVAMVILAGLYSEFIMQSDVQASQSSAVDAAEDLRLAAQVMSTQLKLAVNICWDNTNGLVYQPQDSTVTMTGCSGTIDPSWGVFSFDSSASTGGVVDWRVPGNANKQELLRGLETSPSLGFLVSPQTDTDLGVLRTIKLTSQYQDVDRQDQSLSISFDVLPRNH